jgi:hypothetical protein
MLDAEDIKFFLGSSVGVYGTAAVLCLLAPATVPVLTTAALTFAGGAAAGSLTSNRPKEIYNNISQSFFRQTPNSNNVEKLIFSHTAKMVLSETIDVDDIDNEIIDKMKNHLSSSDTTSNEANQLLSALITINPSLCIDHNLNMTHIQLMRNGFLYLKRFNLKNKIDVSNVLVDAIRTIEVDTDFKLQKDPIFKEIFLETYDIPEIKPLLKIATLATHGLHDLAAAIKDKVTTKLQIIIDPERDDTNAISFGKDENANGTYRRNLIYLGGKRPNNKLLAGTLIHELTHFVADEVFKNDCDPYKREDSKSKRDFKHICHLLRRKKNDVHPVISSVFSKRYCITLVSDFGQNHISRMFNDDNDIIINNTNNAYMLYYHADKDGKKKIFKCAIKNHKLIALLNNKEFDDSVCDDNDIEDEVDTLFVRLTKKTIFTYPKSDWHCELIARVPHLIAMSDKDAPYEDIEPDCPELLTFYRDNFLSACKSHIKTIIERDAKTDLNATNLCVVNKKMH